jgi:uncharacterized protein YndB with AHSA1/START domain
MTKSITHQFFYAYPPEAVWEFLTDPGLIAQWLMPNDFLPIIGHDFQFTIKPMPDFDFDGVIYCKVLEIIPFRKLSYSWKSGPVKGELNIDSVVTWTLNPKENGTELLLDHSGKMDNLPIFDLMHKGWLTNMRKIAEFLKPV